MIHQCSVGDTFQYFDAAQKLFRRGSWEMSTNQKLLHEGGVAGKSDNGISDALSMLLEATEGDRGIVVELVGDFLASYRDRLDSMSAAISAGNAEDLEKSSHRFKGSLGLFSRTEPLNLTEQLIEMGERNSLAEAPRTLELLQMEMEKLVTSLMEFCRPMSITVLIADDDPVIVKLLTILISKAGHWVIAARTGHEVLSLWESERPHMIFMDVRMPKLDGLEATKRLRAREREIGGQVPIYGMTAQVMEEEDVNRCLVAGMTGHIGKPIDFEVVREILIRHRTN
jgi:CheY-like chemotaxis protein/HPt (histidine-containing phosphotransfer) domain-containing protein